MDLLLKILEDSAFSKVYDHYLPLERDSLPRQFISLSVILCGGGAMIYFFLASISYLIYFVLFKQRFHPDSQPQPKPGQVFREIKLALWSMPVMTLLTAPIALLELHGHSKLYGMEDFLGLPQTSSLSSSDLPSWAYFIFSALLFLLFTDTCIYWIHRWEHEIPFLYKYVHKPHHAWFVPTPYAALAFHPVDGWLQSLPYHIFPFIFPFHRVLYLALFVAVQIWTISIHDGVDGTPFGFVNGTAHHTIHHSKFIYNYGQFFTFWDRLGGSHLDPYAPHASDNKEENKKSKVDAPPSKDKEL